ncbi:hypothetical protein GGS21DRAFT_492999 [Xylaria nigripes]|nr:hypothetical protein GGS21DRAFT_492999 [Xylaria nigripes]
MLGEYEYRYYRNTLLGAISDLFCRFRVVVTVRSEGKWQRIAESVKPHQISYVLVEDISQPGAFDHSQTPFDYVVHTASPYYHNVQDPINDFIDPAVKGTTGPLRSIKMHGPTVYDETIWACTSLVDAMNNPEQAYNASKRNLPNLEAMNTSNHRIRDILQGKMKAGLKPMAPVFTWVDVRDVGLAHLRAMTVAEVGGHRFYIVGGHFSNKRIADVILERFPSLADRLPVDAVDAIGSIIASQGRCWDSGIGVSRVVVKACAYG